MSSSEKGFPISNDIMLDEHIGEGGEGSVWKGTQKIAGGTRHVAVKFLRKGRIKSSENKRRLHRQIEFLQSTRHPNIPEYYGADLDYTEPYLYMAYIGGDSYSKLIYTGAMAQIPLLKRMDLIEQLANALNTTHKAGVIHRDIKPSNMKGIDIPYLLDFGTIYSVYEIETTRPNIGTPLYLAPRDNMGIVGDVYSFALSTYEIIFGRHAIFSGTDNLNNPTQASSLATERLHQGKWFFPSQLAPYELPEELQGKDLYVLDEVFARGFALNGADRYQSVEDFFSQLNFSLYRYLHPGIDLDEGGSTTMNVDVAPQTSSRTPPPPVSSVPTVARKAVKGGDPTVLLRTPRQGDPTVILTPPPGGDSTVLLKRPVTQPDAPLLDKLRIDELMRISPLLIGAGALLALVVIAGLFFALTRGTDSEEPPEEGNIVQLSVTNTEVPSETLTDTAVPPTNTLTLTPSQMPSHTPTETATRTPSLTRTNTPVPPTPTPIPPTSTSSPVPPSNTPAPPTDTPIPVQPSPTVIVLSSDLGENLRTLHGAISDRNRYNCMLFNAVYLHISEMRQQGSSAYSEYGEDLVGANSYMTTIYNDYCKDQDRESVAYDPARFPQDENDDLIRLLSIILSELSSQ